MVKIIKHEETNDKKEPGEISSKDGHGEEPIAGAPIGESDKRDEGTDAGHRTIFVGDLPTRINESQLKSVFCRYGTIESCHIKHDNMTKKHLGYGFVKFASRSEACRAFEQKEINGHAIRIGWARKNQTLVISNPGSAGGLEEILARTGYKTDVQSTHFNEGGNCILRFQSRQSAEQFRKKFNDIVISDGRACCRISWSNINFNTVHIHFGKDRSVRVQDILDAFAKFGPVDKIVLPQTETGETKGFGFVYYPYGDKGEQLAAEAIRVMNGAKLCNDTVPIICNYGHRARGRRDFSRHPKAHSAIPLNGENGFDSELVRHGSIYSPYYYDGNSQMLIIRPSYYPIMHTAVFEPGIVSNPFQAHYGTTVEGELPSSSNIPGCPHWKEGQMSQ